MNHSIQFDVLKFNQNTKSQMIQSEIESVDMEVEKYKNIDFKVK